MIENVQIENFRCLKNVELPDCRLVNVVVGKNASGKTALLEALFLGLATSPEMAMRLRGWRGYDQPLSGSFEQIDNAMWGNLFYQFNKNNTVSINITDNTSQVRSLQVRAVDAREVVIPTGSVVQTFMQVPQLGISAYEWRWTRADGSVSTIRPQFLGAGFQFPGVDLETVPASFFASGIPLNSQEAVNRFSDISKKRNDGPVISAICKAFPMIRDVDVQSHAGMSMVHADIPSLPEKIPLGGVSSGVNKVVSILLAMAEKDKSIIIIDEIENGIHYSLYDSFWRTIYNFARDHDVQVFASTHSAECLNALANACKRHSGDISVVRAELDENGDSQLRQFHGSAVMDGIKHGEMR